MQPLQAEPLDVFILGTAYSGSTLLANALNAHSAVASVGELSACFPEFPLGHREPFCPLCAARQVPCPIWTPAFIEQVRGGTPKQALALCRATMKVPVLLDVSKFPEWLRMTYSAGGGTVPSAAVYISKNPFAYHFSNRLHTGRSPETSAGQWIHGAASTFRVVRETGVPLLTVHYDALAMTPKPVLERICQFLSVQFEESMLHFWESELHALNGNAGAYVWYKEFGEKGQFATPDDRRVAEAYRKRTFGGWSDEKWKHGLSEQETNLIANNTAVRRFSEWLGYDLDRLAAEARPAPVPTPRKRSFFFRGAG